MQNQQQRSSSVASRLRQRAKTARRRPSSRRQGNSIFGTNGEIQTVQTMLLPRSVFPARKKCVLRYSDTSQIAAPNTNLVLNQQYLLNGLATVNFTAAAGTPWQWATLAALYDKYRVDRCRFTVSFFDPSIDGMCVGLQLRGPNVAGGLIATTQSRPGTLSANLSNTGDQTVTFKGDIDLRAAFGQSRATYDANYGSTTNANPGANSVDFTCYLQTWACSTIGGTAGTVKISFCAEFDTTLFCLTL